jgi:hypothetical protein
VASRKSTLRLRCPPTRTPPWPAKHLKQRPEWLAVQAQLVEHPTYGQAGRPRTDLPPDRTAWYITTTLAVDEAVLAPTVRRQASFLVAPNILDPTQLTDQELIQTSRQQHRVERGFAFLKDPLFLASSVFVKKPSRIVALSLVMVLCLLVYRLAEHRLREQLAATGQTIPSQVNDRSINRPTVRPCAGCSRVLRGSICCTSATGPALEPRWCSGYNRSTSRC